MANLKTRKEMEDYIINSSVSASKEISVSELKKELKSCSWTDLRETYYAFIRADNIVKNSN